MQFYRTVVSTSGSERGIECAAGIDHHDITCLEHVSNLAETRVDHAVI